MPIRDDEKKASTPPPPPSTPTAPTAYNPASPSSSYTLPAYIKKSAKSLLPYLSPEDAKAQAIFYGVNAPSVETPTAVTSGLRNYYLSKQRATNALGALENMRASTGKGNLGPGYTLLRNVIRLLQTYGGDTANGMTRSAYNQFSTELNSMLSQAKGDNALSYYADLAQQFANPSFSAGALNPTTKLSTGKTVFGQSNKQLYT